MPNNERVSFEAWFAKTFVGESLARTFPPPDGDADRVGFYSNKKAFYTWRAWKAQDKRHKALIKAAQALTESVYLENLERHINTLKTELAKLKETP